jgi:DNA-binding beta-propeller fold protein YncE
MARCLVIAGCLIGLVVVLGCSSSTAVPTAPSSNAPAIQSQVSEPSTTNRILWGYWDMKWNNETRKLEAIPVRNTELHLNVRRYLEDTLCHTCLIIGENFVNADGDLDVEIHIYHPVADAWATGFDVRGIAIFPGTKTFDENGLVISSHDNNEYSLVNPSGYTDLWSQAKFPPGSLRPIFEYSKGKYAVHPGPLSTTLNPFMEYHTLPERNIFQVGKHTSVHYIIRFPKDPLSVPLEFGYAIDASWARPATLENPAVPDDFPIKANAIEAYRVNIEVDSSLTPTGGTALLIIRVFDWQGLDTIKSVKVEGPDLFNGLIDAVWQSNQPTYAEYTATIPNDLIAQAGTYPVLVSVEDKDTVPVIGVVKAYNIANVDVHPVIEFERKIVNANYPVDSAFDSTSGNAFFSPVPLTPNLEVFGIRNDSTVVDGFPKFMSSGGMGFCKGSRQLYVATDLGGGFTTDVTVFNVDTKNQDYTIDIPSVSGFPGSGPLDFVVNENTQEVWGTLFFEDQVAVFAAGVSLPTITRITVGTAPTSIAIDQPSYQVFVLSDGNDTISVIDGFAQTVSKTIPLSTPLVSPDPDLPALAGMAYVSSLDRLYVATLMAGKVDYYDISDGTFSGTIQVLPENQEMILGLCYDDTVGMLIITTQVTSGKSHVFAYKPTDDANDKVGEATTSGMNASFPCIDPSNRRLFVPDPAGLVDLFLLH